jgi:hypothetical protein
VINFRGFETSGLRLASAYEHREKAKEDTHDSPRYSARVYAAPLPRRATSSPRRDHPG